MSEGLTVILYTIGKYAHIMKSLHQSYYRVSLSTPNSFPTCLFRSLPGKRTWPQCASEMVAAWSGVGCQPCRVDKPNCCCPSLSLSLSLDPCPIPPRPVRPDQTETFKQSQRPTKASQMRAGLFRARKRRAWPYPIWHIQYILSVYSI